MAFSWFRDQTGTSQKRKRRRDRARSAFKSQAALAEHAPNLLHACPFHSNTPPAPTQPCPACARGQGGGHARREEVRSERPMLNSRYVVVSEESRWQIV